MHMIGFYKIILLNSLKEVIVELKIYQSSYFRMKNIVFDIIATLVVYMACYIDFPCSVSQFLCKLFMLLWVFQSALSIFHNDVMPWRFFRIAPWHGFHSQRTSIPEFIFLLWALTSCWTNNWFPVDLRCYAIHVTSLWNLWVITLTVQPSHICLSVSEVSMKTTGE